MNKLITLRFPVASLRRIENPQKESRAKDYIAVANIKNLPEELNNWRDVNVRDARLNSSVAKGIRETLDNAPDTFFLKNRGITIVSSRVEFYGDKSILEISFDENDRDHQGILDGGHTFSVIQDYLHDEGEEASDAYVRLEIIEGVTDENEIVGIVEARNKSTQVQEQGIQDLLHKFDPIKEVLANQPYKDNIAYKEYELSEDGTKKTIDIKDILSYLLCFYTDGFNADNHPIKAYTQKKGIVTQYADDMGEEGKKTFKKYLPLLPKILELRDTINRDFKESYKLAGRRFAWLEGIKNDSIGTLEFLGEEIDYRLPVAYVYPLLAAFRTCVQCENNKCKWAVDPIEFWGDIQESLVSRLAEQAKAYNNPDKFGKDPVVWGRCYDTALLEILKRRADAK
jgi:hypothetical protein